MYVVHDYKCPICERVEERFVHQSEVNDQYCTHEDIVDIFPKGQYLMHRLPCSPRVDWDSLAKGANASPEAIRHFEKKHKQQAEIETKRMKEHGDRGKAPGA